MPTGLGFVAITLEDESGVVLERRGSRRDGDRSTAPVCLAGLGTGRARTEEPFAGPSVTTYDGRALAIVRPTARGAVTVTVEAAGLAPAEVVLDVRA